MAYHVSSISKALAGNASTLEMSQSGAGNKIHAPAGRDATSAPAVIKEGACGTGLPTPPNSISPNLQPEAFTAKLAKELAASPALSIIDSDIDLRDATETARNQVLGGHQSEDTSVSEGVGIITPAYLARYHLASMVLERGPIAIRHVIDHLSRNVPGFADIPPAKARRIVVAALESRSGGGLNGEVEFVKVGWGRWDAKVKGQPSRSHRVTYPHIERPLSPSNSAISSSAPTRAVRVPGHRGARAKSRRLSHSSCTAESTFSSRSEHGGLVDADVVENEAASMSIDEEEGEQVPGRTFHVRLPYRMPSRRPAQCNDYSDTDEEDWSQIDPAALSCARVGGNNKSKHSKLGTRRGGHSTPASFSSQGWSIPAQNRLKPYHQIPAQRLDFTGVDMDSQEKSAIEALLQMGSM